MNRKDNILIENERKAEIALKRIEGASPADLEKEYGIEQSLINKWADRLKEDASLIFSDKKAQGEEDEMDRPSLMETALEATPNGLLITNLDGSIVSYNKRCGEMWGISNKSVRFKELDNALSYVVSQVKHPEEYRKSVKDVYKNPKKVIRDTVELKDGRIFQRYSIPYGKGDDPKGRVTSFTDITDHIKREKKLRGYGELLDSITTNVNEGIIRSTPDEGLIYVNEAFIDIFGYDSREEVLAMDPREFFADADYRNEFLEKLREQKQIVNKEILFKRKDGTTFLGLENSTLVESNDNIYIDSVVHDISEWKEAEQALRESEEKYRSILANIEDGYFETDLEGNLTFFNDTLCSMLDYSADELMGMNNREYMDEENAARVFEAFNKVYETGEPQKAFDWELSGKDGGTIFVETSINLRRNAEGEPMGFRGIVRDITDRKEKENKIKNSLREKEVLLGEIHHRVKNNMAVISGLLYLQSEKTDIEAVRSALKECQSRINSMAIVHEMLYQNQTFSRIDPGVYIKELVEYISSNYLSKEKEIKTEVHSDDLQLEMNRAIPCAMIVNELLTNAYKYAFEGKDSGKISVSIKKRNGSLELEISDNGVGFPLDEEEDYAEKGLGLFLVKTFTEQLEGELEIKQNGGTSFVITFPAKE